MPLKPAYLILGDEVLVKMEVAKIKKAVGRETLDFNFDRFNASQASGREVASLANTLPFISERRFIIVENIEKCPKDEVSHLIGYLKNPSESTCLVLIGDSLGEKSELFKAVKAVGEVIHRKVERNKIPLMIKKAFEKRGQVAGDAVVRLLMAAAGEDLTKLGNEIEKVSLYCLGRKMIGVDDARQVVSHSDEIKIFEVTDRIGSKDAPGALRVLESLLQDGFERKFRGKGVRSIDFRMVSREEHARSILSLMTNHFRTLLRLKSLLEEGADKMEIIPKLGLKGAESTKNFLFTKYRRQADSFSLENLKRMPSFFVDADLGLKSTGQPPQAILERVVAELASLR